MLILPITQIWNLQLGTKKKVAVAAMLCVGVLMTIVSILRLRSLVSFANTTNPTYDFYNSGLWSMLELDVGIICVCMPNIRLILVRLFPKVMATANQSRAGISGTGTGKFSKNRTQSTADEPAGISYSRSYVVTKSRAKDDSSFVQLVEIEVDADGKSKGSDHSIGGRDDRGSDRSNV